MTDNELNYAIVITGIILMLLAIISTDFVDKKRKRQVVKVKKKEIKEKIDKARKSTSIIVNSSLDSKIRKTKKNKKES
jgi:uncharacterized membrane protein